MQKPRAELVQVLRRCRENVVVRTVAVVVFLCHVWMVRGAPSAFVGTVVLFVNKAH